MAEHLALPEVGGEPVAFLDFVSERTRSLLTPIEQLFESTECAPPRLEELERRPVGHHVEVDEYPRVVLKLLLHKMIELRKRKPRRINGLFGVPKGKVEDPLTRMITNAERTNWHTRKLPPVKLPNPSTLLKLPAWVKKAAALDIQSFYNCLKLPEEWREHFGLPAVNVQGEWVFPVNTTLPMGWTGSVLLGQEVHETLFAQAIASLPDKLQYVKFVSILDEEAMERWRDQPDEGVIFYSIYLDDLNLFGINGEQLDGVLRCIIDHYRQQGFPVKDSKTTWACAELRVLGIWCNLEDGILEPVPAAITFLYYEAVRLARSKRPVDRLTIQSFLGKLTWACLLRRPSLSVLATTYAFAEEVAKNGPKKVWPEVRKELLQVWGLLPLLYGKLATTAELVIASDATGTDASGWAGLGVAYTSDVTVNRCTTWGPEQTPEGWQMAHWRWAVSMKIKSKSHVNIHEMLGLLLAGQVGLSHGLLGHKEAPIFLVDNTAVVGAASKGRSSSGGLNLLLRRWAGFLFMRGWCTPFIKYVPTKLNPADAPSRAYREEWKSRGYDE